MAYQLPQLSYDLAALEPHIDAKTMEIHHGKHHAAYVSKLNDAVQGTSFESMSIEELLININEVPADKQTAVRNNGGGHANHSLFWQILTPQADAGMSPALAKKIEEDLGGFDNFKAQFEAAAATRFGSGWAWLALKQGKLVVFSTPNQDSPYMENMVPILGLDVWEHAYYLNYQNRRPDYIAAFWEVVNWSVVSENFAKAV